ncbi:MAG TPA: ROK family protein [Lichenihabitans sp.]|nr:ROK family protein [Lichenihabitans sp.]
MLERRESPTDRAGGPDAWIAAAGRLVAGWDGVRAAGIAVTGLIRGGLWRALNPDTLPVPDNFPLADKLRQRLRMSVTARNDAQAAAWGEYRFGGAGVQDLIFVTVSTGIGGGIVARGRLVEGRTGLAGHIGITPVETPSGVRRFEDLASGRALNQLAQNAGPITKRRPCSSPKPSTSRARCATARCCR